MFGYGDINSSGGLVMEKQLSDESRKILLGTFEDIAKSKETAACEFLRTSKSGRSIWVHLKLKYITSVGEKHIIRRYAYRYYGTADDGSGTAEIPSGTSGSRKRQSGRCWLWMIRR